MIKVLIGESHGCEVDAIVPSKAGLRTVLEVLKIQMNFWSTLEPVLSKLQSKWELYAFEDRSECICFYLNLPFPLLYSNLTQCVLNDVKVIPPPSHKPPPEKKKKKNREEKRISSQNLQKI